MRKLYCKSTEKRRREFQIYTMIVEEDNKRYAVKEAVYPAGRQHLEKMLKNYEVLKEIYGSQIVESWKQENQVFFPYIEGDTYTVKLMELLQNGTDAEIKSSLSDWKKLILGREENITDFKMQRRFEEIFGDAEELTGDRALKITNFDCIADNMIFSADGIKLIDYEWVFDFPIPEEFTYYRVLKVFYLKHRESIELERLLSLAGMSKEKTIIYERLLDKFDLYVVYDNINDLNYSGIGKQFKSGRIRKGNYDDNIVYQFPENEIAPDSSVVIYGAGEVGLSYYLYLKKTGYCTIAAWIDKNYEKYQKQRLDVAAIDSVAEITCDFIVIAVYNDIIAHNIMDFLLSKGVSKEKIFWKKPQYI